MIRAESSDPIVLLDNGPPKGPVFRIEICGLSEASDFMNTSKWDHIVSIKCPALSIEPQTRITQRRQLALGMLCDSVLCLDFWDDDEVPPAMVREIVAFARNLKPDDRILVHCFAGISRSSAAAVILMREHGVSHNEAMAHVIRIRSHAQPNQRMLEIYDALFASSAKKDGIA